MREIYCEKTEPWGKETEELNDRCNDEENDNASKERIREPMKGKKNEERGKCVMAHERGRGRGDEEDEEAMRKITSRPL